MGSQITPYPELASSKSFDLRVTSRAPRACTSSSAVTTMNSGCFRSWARNLAAAQIEAARGPFMSQAPRPWSLSPAMRAW